MLLTFNMTIEDSYLEFMLVSDTWGCKHHKALASDGQYLYLHSSRGLFKLGSGYAGTIRAHVYLHKPDFYPDKRGWLGYAQVINVCCLDIVYMCKI